MNEYDNLIIIHKKCIELKRIVNKNIIFSIQHIKSFLKNNNHRFNSFNHELNDIIKTYTKSINIYSFLTYMNILLINNFNNEYLISINNELELIRDEYINLTNKLKIKQDNNIMYINIIIKQVELLINNKGEL